VTILHRGARPLQGFDPDLVALLVTHTRELGVRIELSAEVCGIEKSGDGVMVRAMSASKRLCLEPGSFLNGRVLRVASRSCMAALASGSAKKV
jgi:pyruvate/2-oxoglutarate dehydrogenase complex dihydrolipoamide dehydrogenase (E3) component